MSSQNQNDESRIQELKNQGVKTIRNKAECSGDVRQLELYTLQNTVRKRKNRAAKKLNGVNNGLSIAEVSNYNLHPANPHPLILEILPEEKIIKSHHLEQEYINNIARIINTKDEPKRATLRRMTMDEQKSIIEFKRRDNSSGIPFVIINNMLRLYEKLRIDDGSGLRLQSRDEELLKDLETKLKELNFI